MSNHDDNEMAFEALAWIVNDIYERKHEADNEVELRKDDFSKGRKLAYYEVTDIIISRLKVLGINIDIDKT